MKLTHFIIITIFMFSNCTDKKYENTINISTDHNIFKIICEADDFRDLLFLYNKIMLKIDNEISIFGQIDDIYYNENHILILDSKIGKKVLKFDASGNFECMFGGIGDGPGEYRHPITIYVSNHNKVLILNNNPPDLHVFSFDNILIETIPSHRFPGIFDPQNIDEIDDYYVCYVPGRNGKRIRILDNDFRIVDSFLSDEPAQRKAKLGGGGICVINNYIWVVGAYNPIVSIYDIAGNMIHQTGLHLLNNPKILNNDDIKDLDKGDYRELLSILDNKNITTKIMNLDDQIVITGDFVYSNSYHFDIYDKNGKLIYNQLPFKTNNEKFIKVQDDYILTYSIDDPEIVDNDEINAILYIYKPIWKRNSET